MFPRDLNGEMKPTKRGLSFHMDVQLDRYAPSRFVKSLFTPLALTYEPIECPQAEPSIRSHWQRGEMSDVHTGIEQNIARSLAAAETEVW